MSSIFTPRVWAVLAAVGLVMGACREAQLPTTAPKDNPPESLGPVTNPSLHAVAPVRSLTVKSNGGTLMPASVTLVLAPGATATEHKVASPWTPGKGDIVFVLELTAGEAEGLPTMKADVVDIMNAVAETIDDVRFSVVGYQDYPATYSSCGVTATYGGPPKDLPYRLFRALTPSTMDVAGVINGLTTGWGADGVSPHSRVLYELYAELTPAGASSYGPIGWRPGARRIALDFSGMIAHDCNASAIYGGTPFSTGKDPGRDGLVNTADDLKILDVVQGLKANNITVLNVFLDPGNMMALPFWKALTDSTGGAMYLSNWDAVIPGGTRPISGKIVELIQPHSPVGMVGRLTLGVCSGSASYAGWIAGVSPAAFTNIPRLGTKEFDLTLGPPAGTPAGSYTFDVCLIGDGEELASQSVTIEVVQPVTIDIKPGSVPNPVNPKAKGVLPVAVLSVGGFDASRIDPATVTLGDEVGNDTPVAARKNGTLFAALEDVNGDGMPDMILQFDVPALVANGDLTASSTRLVLRGMLQDGITAIRGKDSIRIVP